MQKWKCLGEFVTFIDKDINVHASVKERASHYANDLT